MSKWNLLWGRWGTGAGETDEIRIDGVTNFLSVIDCAHHEIHSGSSFHALASAAGGAGTKATLSFTTPDSTTYAHCIFTFRANVESVITFGEAITVTGLSGADYVPRNRNRNSGTASTLISAGSAGGAGNVTINGTVTNFGTVLREIQIGIGKTGGLERELGEWILLRNTTYAIEVESQAAASEVSVELDWYEHVNLHT